MLLLTSGCAVAPSDNAICSGTETPRANHAGALLDDGGRKSKDTGAILIGVIEAYCVD